MITQLRSFSTAILPAPTSIYDRDSSNGVGTEILEDMQLVTHLLSLGQLLCEQSQGAVMRLRQEVKLITGGRAELLFGRHLSAKRVQLPPTTLITLPIQFGHVVYGALCIAFDPIHTEQPAIPLPVAQLLAQACSWLLYTIEQSTFLQGQCQQLDYQVNGPLTKREREVLILMCRGHNQEMIADMLCISPATVGKHRQHIYEQLGVHCERDALLAAYHTGLFSVIEEDAS
ncbi:MAG TPA: helix-turn-helix transcriptional regulator [Ktedonobacteraceae bacterium]|nr:helix-turn-helix transcriptional regulator [Ktedonobacteraceae bacterium]